MCCCIGAEEDIGGEAFTWSRAHTFSFHKNSIGKATAYATATRLHLSVHCTALPSHCQAGQPMSSAECLMHGAAHALHRTPPRPAVNVVGGAHNVAPSAHATHAGAFGEADVVADDAHAAGGVAAADWLQATFGGGDSNASMFQCVGVCCRNKTCTLIACMARVLQLVENTPCNISVHCICVAERCSVLH